MMLEACLAPPVALCHLEEMRENLESNHEAPISSHGQLTRQVQELRAGDVFGAARARARLRRARGAQQQRQRREHERQGRRHHTLRGAAGEMRILATCPGLEPFAAMGGWEGRAQHVGERR